MDIKNLTKFEQREKSEVLVLPFWKGESGLCEAFSFDFQSEAAELLDAYRTPVKNLDFKGVEGECFLVYTRSQGTSRLILLGLGEKESCEPESIRRAYACVSKYCSSKSYKKIQLVPSLAPKGEVYALEGLSLASYAFDALKSHTLKEPSSLVEVVTFFGLTEESFRVCQEKQKVIECVHLARDLVNGNADDVTPQKLVAVAEEIAKDFSSVKTHSLNKKELEEKGFGLILAVNRASFRDPALILMEYRGDPDSKDITAIVGKGITFDTGGLNLKPTGSMETMKDDMAGAAAVLGTMRSAATLKLKVNLVGVIATTENSIGCFSYKPGDVYKSYSGKTVEISNTDAEGRLVLADALSYVQKTYAPSRIIDLATLTGGVLVALGEEVTGLFSNDDTLSTALAVAGESTYERVWRFPLYAEYKEALKSTIADVKNSGNRNASAINGAMFLKEFIEKTPWAHLDIAGTAFLSKPRHYHPTSATGVGVRLLVEFLQNHEKSKQ